MTIYRCFLSYDIGEYELYIQAESPEKAVEIFRESYQKEVSSNVDILCYPQYFNSCGILRWDMKTPHREKYNLTC